MSKIMGFNLPFHSPDSALTTNACAIACFSTNNVFDINDMAVVIKSTSHQDSCHIYPTHK